MRREDTVMMKQQRPQRKRNRSRVRICKPRAVRADATTPATDAESNSIFRLQTPIRKSSGIPPPAWFVAPICPQTTENNCHGTQQLSAPAFARPPQGVALGRDFG